MKQPPETDPPAMAEPAEPAESRRLFREAADLAIRLQNDPANAVSADIVRAWAARSQAHAAAWARVAEIHGMTGKVLAARDKAAGGAMLTRRSLLVGGVGLVGAGAFASGDWRVRRLFLMAFADQITDTAEIRPVALADGSTMTLGPQSAVAFDMSGARREVRLLAGMAYFQVAGDTAPFRVSTGSAQATSRGASRFDISDDAGFVSVAVESGAVEASAREGPGQSLTPGASLILSSTQARVGAREPGQVASWRAGMLMVEQETVAAVIAKIARWQSSRIVMADPGLGARLVSGVFDLSDPQRALDAVARPFGAHVRGVRGFVSIVSPA